MSRLDVGSIGGGPGGVIVLEDDVARWARLWEGRGRPWYCCDEKNNVNDNKETAENEDAEDFM